MSEQCTGDGICVEVCPKDVLEVVGGKARTVAGTQEHCLRCAQCVLVCPREALTLDALPGETYERAPKWSFSYEDLLAFLRTRRSVRRFKDQPVDRAMIDQVLEACASAPPAFPPHPTEVVVLDQREDIEKLKLALVNGYDKLLGYFRNPIARFQIRRKRGPETFHALETHVLNIVRHDNIRFRAHGVDRYLYGAPVLLLFHANRWVAAHQNSGMVVATYAMLAAHGLGLGATMLDIVPPVLNNLDHNLCRSYGIPDDNVVITHRLPRPRQVQIPPGRAEAPEERAVPAAIGGGPAPVWISATSAGDSPHHAIIQRR